MLSFATGLGIALSLYSKTFAANFLDKLIIPVKATDDLTGLILKAVNVILLVAGVVAFIVLIFGGIGYMTSSGDPEKAEKAKNTIIYAIIGIVVVMLAYAIVMFIAKPYR